MAGRIVETAYIANITDLKAKMAEAAAIQEKTGNSFGTAFEKGTSKAGAAVSKFSSLGASFGLPFTSSLDKIAEKFDEAGSHASKFQGIVSEIGKLSWAAGIAGAGAAAVEGVHLADSYEKAHASLTAAVQAAGSGMPQWQSQIDATEKKMESLGFTNAQVESALASGVVATQSVGKSLNLMGLAADLAREKHTDLNTAMGVLDKTMAGNLRALKQMGIDLPVVASSAAKLQASQLAVAEAQAKVTALQQSGQTGTAKYATAQLELAKAQYTLQQQSGTTQKILDALNQRLGGQASQYTQTFAGKMSVLSAQFEDAGKNLGLWLIPKLTDLMNFVSTHIGVIEALAAVLGGVLGLAMIDFAVTKVAQFVGGIGKMIQGAQSLAQKWSATAAGIVSEDGTIITANEAVGRSWIALLGPIALVAAAAATAWAILKPQQLGTDTVTALQTTNLQTQLNTDIKHKIPYSLAGFNDMLKKTQGYSKGEHFGIQGGKAVILGGPKAAPSSSPSVSIPSTPGITQQDLAGLAGAAAAASSSKTSTAITPAQLALELSGIQQNEALKLATNKGAGGSLAALTKDLTNAHKAALEKLITELNATHNANLTKLAATLQTTLSTAIEKLAEGQTLATTASADVVAGKTARRQAITTGHTSAAQAAVALSGLLSTQTVNQVNAATQALQDAAKLTQDAADAELQAAQDQVQAAHDAATGQVQAIQDQTQIQVDTLAERGLYGYALRAQMAQVALDQQKATDDANIAAAQAHLDQVTADQHALVSEAQAKADQVASDQNAQVAALQATADSTAISSSIQTAASQAADDQARVEQAVKDAAAQAHVDAVMFGTQAQQQQATANQKLVNAQDANAVAVADANLAAVTDAQNQANQNAQNSYAQGQALAAQLNASAQQALQNATNQMNQIIQAAQAQLQTTQDTSAVTEARLQSQVDLLNELANIQFKGGAFQVNIYGLPLDNAGAIADELSFLSRSQFQVPSYAG